MPVPKGCSELQWQREATKAAIEAGLDPVRVMAGSRPYPYVAARWKAWRALRARGCSLHSIAKASGFNHTSVRYACLPERPYRGEYKNNTPNVGDLIEIGAL